MTDEQKGVSFISFDMDIGFFGETDWARLASFGGSIFSLPSDLDWKSVLMEERGGRLGLRVFCGVFCGDVGGSIGGDWVKGISWGCG